MHCRCIDASTSTLPHLSTFTSSHAHIRRSTSPPHHTHTSAHLYHICASTLSLLHICPVFLSFFLHIFSLVSVRLHLRTLTSTDLPLHLHTSTDLYRTCTSHCHSFTSTLSFSLSIHLFDSAGQLHVSLSGQPSSSSSCFRNIQSLAIYLPPLLISSGDSSTSGMTVRYTNLEVNKLPISSPCSLNLQPASFSKASGTCASKQLSSSSRMTLNAALKCKKVRLAG